MKKHMGSKNHTIQRLRGQRNFLRRVAQVPVKGLQECDGSEKEEPMHTKVIQRNVDNESEEQRKSSPILKCNSCMSYHLPANSTLRNIKKLEKRLDQVRAELEGEKNKILYWLQPTHEVRAEEEEIRLAPVFTDEVYFTMSPVDDSYACAVARQNALAAHVRAQFRTESTNNATREAMHVTARRKSLPSETEDHGRFHFIREVFGKRAYTT